MDDEAPIKPRISFLGQISINSISNLRIAHPYWVQTVPLGSFALLIDIV